MFRIFKEFISHAEAYGGDINALILNVAGGLLIGLTFLAIGIICVVLANNKTRSRKRQRLTLLFGLFLISCSFSRFLSVLCIWHNYAILDGWVKVLTGLLALIAITILPKTVEEAMHERAMVETYDILSKTQDDLKELKNLSEKIAAK